MNLPLSKCSRYMQPVKKARNFSEVGSQGMFTSQPRSKSILITSGSESSCHEDEAHNISQFPVSALASSSACMVAIRSAVLPPTMRATVASNCRSVRPNGTGNRALPTPSLLACANGSAAADVARDYVERHGGAACGSQESKRTLPVPGPLASTNGRVETDDIRPAPQPKMGVALPVSAGSPWRPWGHAFRSPQYQPKYAEAEWAWQTDPPPTADATLTGIAGVPCGLLRPTPAPAAMPARIALTCWMAWP
mmetsp:Transcript_13510/g.43116  ORF Transcript_13510/g.43116 Transcript_13510/m.43116 type:complete len:251 (-) Transcript_13510:84-836(-)